MNYRPQFARAGPPPGFRDEEFISSWNAVDISVFGRTLAAGETLENIPLPLETNAIFVVRALLLAMDYRLTVQFREPGGMYLSSGLVPASAYLPAGYVGGSMLVAFEPEIECPPGGVFLLTVSNPTAAAHAIAGAVTLFGVKRYAK